MKQLGAALLGGHVLILRLRLEGGKSALRELSRGTKLDCEREKWHFDLTPARGPGIVSAELHVIKIGEWKRICSKQVPRAN